MKKAPSQNRERKPANVMKRTFRQDQRYARGIVTRDFADGIVARIRGALGELVALADLPEAGAQRWGLAMKTRVVVAVESGLITLAVTCIPYDMSLDEYASWRAQVVARNYPHLAWLKAPPSSVGARRSTDLLLPRSASDVGQASIYGASTDADL